MCSSHGSRDGAMVSVSLEYRFWTFAQCAKNWCLRKLEDVKIHAFFLPLEVISLINFRSWRKGLEHFVTLDKSTHFDKYFSLSLILVLEMCGCGLKWSYPLEADSGSSRRRHPLGRGRPRGEHGAILVLGAPLSWRDVVRGERPQAYAQSC